MQRNKPQKVVVVMQDPEARPKGKGQYKTADKAENHQTKRRRPGGMSLPSQQPEEQPEYSPAGEDPDWVQETWGTCQNVGRKQFFLFRSKILVPVLAGLYRTL
jgi:hypothetical protein